MDERLRRMKNCIAQRVGEASTSRRWITAIAAFCDAIGGVLAHYGLIMLYWHH